MSFFGNSLSIFLTRDEAAYILPTSQTALSGITEYVLTHLGFDGFAMYYCILGNIYGLKVSGLSLSVVSCNGEINNVKK